jgi:tetratricopeptide (TPR) repeat protein
MKNDQLDSKIAEITRRAKNYSFDGKHQASIDEYHNALDLIGQNVKKSKHAVMLYSGIGEVYFLQQKWEEALEYYGNAVQSEGGLGEPLIHLRLGQLRYELDQKEKAKDELLRAYMGGGEKYFEDENPKYLALISSLINKQN